MDAILLSGVRTHNLKNFNLSMPHRKFYVITGVSGSGKSSLAFDTLYAEGQRRYVESLSSYARQFLERMEKPDVESVSGIPPAIAIEAKNVITNARSTVGTQTEINDYLRLLFARVGKTFCLDCDTEVSRQNPAAIAQYLLTKHDQRAAVIFFPVPLGKTAKSYLKESLAELERQGFLSFFSGGRIMEADELSLKRKASEPLFAVVDQLRIESKNQKRIIESLELAHRTGKGNLGVALDKETFHFSEGFRCVRCSRTYREPAPNLFSFNSPLGACSACQGFGRIITLDWGLVVPDERKSLYEGAIEPWTKPSSAWEFQQMLKFCRRKKIPVNMPWKDLKAAHRKLIMEGEGKKDYFSVRDFFKFLETKTYKMHVRVFLSKYRGFTPCSVCHETRLKPEALAVKVAGKNIDELQRMNVADLYAFLETLTFSESERNRVEPVFIELQRRVRFLKDVGLTYLTLARLSRTLSGGEVQRIHLATSLGSALVDTLYVLDEPSVGLHERDNELLIRLLRELRDLGNTVAVVEHDRMMIEAADEVIDLGPGGGEKGGNLLYQGSVRKLTKAPESLTGAYLSGKKVVKRRGKTGFSRQDKIKIHRAEEHNLKSIDVDIPLGGLVVITGVSGSGKSTLLYEILYRHYQKFRGRPVQDAGRVQSIQGYDKIDEMVLVDQAPIGRSPRSNPVTYLKAFDEIRKVFAAQPSARQAGWNAGSFSFNVDGGRCDVCKGDGRMKIEMHFLADVFVTCEACRGKRFKEDLLEIRYNDKNVDEVLNLTIEDAFDFFRDHAKIQAKLELLRRVGLGYLRLGQSATTLSGGEAQRLKLAAEIAERNAQHMLYLFDEPTTGLHYHDIHYLMEAFEELLARKHSIIVIEHNMEIIRAADWLIDLGPEGGHEGGGLVFAGTPKDIMRCKESYTGQYLSKSEKNSLMVAAPIEN